MHSEIVIIIVNWNGIEFLQACLRSIAENPPNVSYEVIVVDNASSDGSVEWLRSDEAKHIFVDGNFKLIESEENLGFGRGNNLAINESTAPYVLLLNPDTIVLPGSLDKLIDVLQESDETGAVAPRLLNTDGTLQESVINFPDTPFTILLRNFRIHRLFPKKFVADKLLFAHWAHNERRPVPIVWGAVMLFKGDILRRLQGFDEDFFVYGEDVDICIRLNKLNYKLIFVPEAEIVHIGGKSAVQKWRDTEINYKKLKMGFLVERKHCSHLQRISINLMRMMVEGVRYVINPFLGRTNSRALETLRLYWNESFRRRG